MKLPKGVKCVIRASDISSFLFCEHQLGKEKIWTLEKAKGTKLHNDFEKESESMSGEAITLEEAKNLSINLIIAEKTLTNTYENILLIGKPDRATRVDGVWTIEDKKTTKVKKEKVFDNQKFQTYFYCELIKNNLNDNADYRWKVHLQDQQSREIYHSEEGYYGPEEREQTLKIIKKIRDIMLGEINPEHHNNSNKCKFCSVKNCNCRLN